MVMKLYAGPYTKVTNTEVTSDGYSFPWKSRRDYPPSAPYDTYYPGYMPASTRYYASLTTPHFNKLVEDGWVIQCPFTRVTRTFVAVPGSYQIYNKYGSTGLMNSEDITNLCPLFQEDKWGFVSKLPTYPVDRTRASQESLTRAFAKANASDADLLVDLTQIRQLINMFVKAAKTLLVLVKTPGAFVDLAKAMIKGNERMVRIPPSGKKVPVTSLDGLWCELRFGWRPLLDTIAGVEEAFNRADLEQSKRITYRATENVEKEESNVTTWLKTWSSGCLVVSYTGARHTETWKYSSSFRAGVLLEESTTLARALGLDTRFLPVALWDLVPYSFIVDRFVNVGNWIRSLRPIPSNKFGGAWVAERFTVEHRLRSEFLPYVGSCGTGTNYRFYQRTAGWSEGLEITEGYVRTIHQSAPLLPTLRHDWSEYKDLFNLVDVIMLAIQRARPTFHR